MKKLILIYIAVFGIWFVIYGISICDQYVALKYEIETIDNVVVINRVYEIVNMSTIINLVWFVLSAILFVIFVVQYKRRNKKQTDERIIKSHGEQEGVHVNGAPHGLTAGYTDFMLRLEKRNLLVFPRCSMKFHVQDTQAYPILQNP